MNDKVEDYTKEKELLEKKLKTLQAQEYKIEQRLRVLSFPDKIKFVRKNFLENRYNYSVLITRGDIFDIDTKYITELNRIIVVFTTPYDCADKLMEIIESAAVNEMSKKI